MRPQHVLLALVVAAIWGFNFVITYWGLIAFPPFLLAALRFAVAALPVLVLPRPAISWPRMALIGGALFVGQFCFLYLGMRAGVPPGVASVVLQSQAFFTILFAALALGERPTVRQVAGMLVAGLGLLTIGTSVAPTGGDLTVLGLGLAIGSAISWACGNILLRRETRTEMLPLMSWMSLLPPVPLLLLSLAFDGPDTVLAAVAGAGWLGWVSVAYLAVLATIFGFGSWGWLLKRYPASVVAPFSLLVPLFGVVSSVLVLGEQVGALRLAGMAAILSGLAIVALPVRWMGGFARAR